jgi:hypothetical protein
MRVFLDDGLMCAKAIFFAMAVYEIALNSRWQLLFAEHFKSSKA